MVTSRTLSQLTTAVRSVKPLKGFKIITGKKNPFQFLVKHKYVLAGFVRKHMSEEAKLSTASTANAAVRMKYVRENSVARNLNNG